MKKNCLLLWMFVFAILQGCKEQNDETTLPNLAQAILGVDQLIDLNAHDILLFMRTETVNEYIYPGKADSLAGGYDISMSFGNSGNGFNSELYADDQALKLQTKTGTYEQVQVFFKGSGPLKIKYLKQKSTSAVGNFSLEVEQGKRLRALVNFNVESGLSKNQDIVITWDKTTAPADSKVFIALCVSSSPCQFYESENSGKFVIPQSKLSGFASKSWGLIYVTRVEQLSDVPTDTGVPLKYVKAVKALHGRFEVL